MYCVLKYLPALINEVFQTVLVAGLSVCLQLSFMLTAICRRQVVCVVDAGEFTLVPLRIELPQLLIVDRNMIILKVYSSTTLWPMLFLNIKQVKKISVQAVRFPGVQAPRFQENRHTKWVRLSVLRTSRPYPLEVFLVLIFVRSWVDPGAIV
jgi:hypothetical protein